MAFNESFEVCDSHNMKLLTNKDVASYDQILTMENFDKFGRKMLWIGAQKKLKEKWIWADYHSPEWPWNGQEVQVQPWGLQEPSGDDCVVADSALHWNWNSVRCVISAHVVCQKHLQRCPSPDVNAGSYIKTSTYNS